MEASAELGRVAEVFTGQPVQVMRFQDVDWEDEFDGIWACASLLHVPQGELPDVVDRLTRALRPGGVLYASFKQGGGERVEGTGRHFTDMDEAGMLELSHRTALLEALTVWTNNDNRSEERLS